MFVFVNFSLFSSFIVICRFRKFFLSIFYQYFAQYYIFPPYFLGLFAIFHCFRHFSSQFFLDLAIFFVILCPFLLNFPNAILAFFNIFLPFFWLFSSRFFTILSFLRVSPQFFRLFRYFLAFFLSMCFWPIFSLILLHFLVRVFQFRISRIRMDVTYYIKSLKAWKMVLSPP